MNSIQVAFRFKLFPNVVCDDEKQLWILDHCPRKRTIPYRKLTYNENRKSYRINGVWITRKRLLNLRYNSKEKIILKRGVEFHF